jgi:nucleotide-binding universal stress UspA family protein
VGRILLASEGRPITPEAVEAAASLAHELNAEVRVFSIARIWGTSLGLPMPGLLPSKQEWDVQRENVRQAVEELRGRGLDVQGQVIATRKPGKRIVREAQFRACDAIVMSADPSKRWLRADFMWSQEPQRVRRRAARANIPVRLVGESDRK